MGDNKSPFGKDPLKPYAYAFAGLAMMLNIRLVYSAAPYALLRFKLPENLFSVFVRVMAGSLELWCLPGFVVINIMDFARKSTSKEWYHYHYHYQSIVVQWLNFLTFVILWISFIIGGDQGNVTAFYWVIAASGFVFGINNPLVYAMEFQYLSWYMIGENSFPMVTSLMHYVGTLLFGNRRKWNSDYIIVTIDIIISLAISLAAAVLWTYAYYKGEEAGDGYPPKDPNQRNCKTLNVQPSITTSGTDPELTYSIGPNWAESHAEDNCGLKKFNDAYYAYFIPPTLMVIVGMGLVYAIYPGIAPGMIVPFYLIDKIEMVLLIATTVPPIIIGILKEYGYNPYVNKGNWGYEHKKSCKSNTENGGTLDTKGDCNDCNTNCTADSLKLKDDLTPAAAGTAVTLTGTGASAGFSANASITITSNDVDFTELDSLTISINRGTIKNKENNLRTASPQLNENDVLALDANGTLSGGATVKLEGTIVVTSNTQQSLGSALNFGGGPNAGVSGTINLQDGTGEGGNTHVNITTGNLTITGDALSGLKGASGTLNIGTGTPDTPVKYSLVTQKSIILGLSTLNNLSGVTGAKVTLTGLPTSSIKIAPRSGGTSGISAESAYGTTVTFSQTDSNFTNLKSGSGSGLTLNLATTFNGATITKTAGGALTTGENLTPDTMLNISGTSGGTTIQITSISVTKSGSLNGSATYDLTGGITGTISSLTDSGGGVQGQLQITKISYDSYEFHDKHKSTLCCFYGKVWKWREHPLYQWHMFTILVPLKICLAAIFIYSLHYRDSSLSRSIINQPKMSTTLSIIFYMCHEILLAMGFPGVASDDYVLLPMQLIGAYLMVLLAYYSVGYITEYKRHDPSQWPTEGMTKWNAMCYWLKMASKITNKNFKQLFTTDLRRDLLLCIQKNELI